MYYKYFYVGIICKNNFYRISYEIFMHPYPVNDFLSTFIKQDKITKKYKKFQVSINKSKRVNILKTILCIYNDHIIIW